MKRIFLFLTVCAIISCNNEKAVDSGTAANALVPADMHGFTANYSMSFVMDSAKNTETVLSLWKAWQAGDLSKARPYFADSVTFFMSDGTNMFGPTDTLMQGMQAYRSSFKEMKATVDAAFAVTSTDKNENWVAIWGSEIRTDMNGKVDTISQVENWRFNKDGKVNLMFQAERKGMIPPPPGK